MTKSERKFVLEITFSGAEIVVVGYKNNRHIENRRKTERHLN